MDTATEVDTATEADMTTEAEMTTEVDTATELPARLAIPADLDLADAVSGLTVHPGQTIERRLSTWDTSDRRLARNGISLSYVDSEWRLRLPDGEQRVAGAATTVPAALRLLVTGWVRAATLAVVHAERIRRTPYELVDVDGIPVGRILDDQVATLEGGRLVATSRVLIVEAAAGRLISSLRAAGAKRLDDRPPAAVLGELPDLGPLSPASGSGALLAHALGTHAGRLIELDLAVRRDEPDAVHQMRVTCRRLRGVLRTFRPLVAAEWAADLSAELAWLAGSLGDARDLEVLRERLAVTGHADPLAPLPDEVLDRVDGLLAEREAGGQAAAAAVLSTRRYAVLLERVVAGAQSPVLSAEAAAPARDAVLPLVAGVWRAFAKRADRLDPTLPDEVWHRVRILGKRARYALEAVEAAFGRPAGKLARRLARVQDTLGEHQDAAIAAGTLLGLGRENPADAELVLACGRLAERERAAVRAARAAFAERWPGLSGAKATRWLTD
ncbi:MAG TPA: CHAD domain-containing protein [Mycobacteriales bacterium]|nr:CHAD domain-containing protein [Mycobacteriales bacterium]